MFSNALKKIKLMTNLGLLCVKYRQEALHKQYEFELLQQLMESKDNVIAAMILESGGTFSLSKETVEKVVKGNFSVSSSTDAETESTVLFVNDKSEQSNNS